MNCILAALALIGLLLVGLVIVAGVGLWTIGSAALGIKTLSAHYKYSDASLMPTVETVGAEPQHCVSNDGDCRIVTVTVYREDKPAFHQALRQTIDRHGGSYAPRDYGVYYALLPPELARQLRDIADAPLEQRVSPGYAEWAQRATAKPRITMATQNRQGVYILVKDDCQRCLFNGWFLIAVSIAGVITVFIVIHGAVTENCRHAGQTGESQQE